MKSLDLVIFMASAVLGVASRVQAMVEECPTYCSPINNNYGPACASIANGSPGKTFWTFPNLCELYKQRCYNQRFGLAAIEFVSDGSCSSSVKKTNECPVICSPDNNKFGSVCASVGDSYKTYPNLCVMLREKCTNERNGMPTISYEKDGSCTIPFRGYENEGSPQKIERMPQKIERSPQTIERTPQTIERGPQKIERMPQIIERTPQKIERMPQKIERTPQTIERMPQKIERMPQKIERMPEKVEQIPQINEPLQRQELGHLTEDPTKNEAQMLDDPTKQDG